LELLKESKLSESLTQKEKQEAINYALRITHLPITEKTYGIFGKKLLKRIRTRWGT
jgi:hypothetical protein